MKSHFEAAPVITTAKIVVVFQQKSSKAQQSGQPKSYLRAGDARTMNVHCVCEPKARSRAVRNRTLTRELEPAT